MGSRYISRRERELAQALEERNVEQLFWWIVNEHKQNLLDGERSHLAAGLFRLALEHLSKLHIRRDADADGGADVGDQLAELERVLKVVG
jgi:hypothetical protein